MSFYTDKVCVVTGGAGGIGREIVKQLDAQGAKVVMVDILAGEIDKSLALMTGPGEVVGYHMDVTEEEAWPALRDFTLEKFGKVDILFNNAGIMYAKGAGTYNSTDWQYFFEANVMSAVYGCTTFAPVMEKQGFGHISTTASTAALGPNGGDGIADPYSPTKAAVLTYKEQFAINLAMKGSPVTCSVIMPCVVKSELGARLDWPDYLPKKFQDKRHLIDTRPAEMAQSARDVNMAFLLPKGHPAYEQFRAMGVMDTDEAVEIILKEIELGYFYIYTHPHMSYNVNLVEFQRRNTPWSQPVSIAEAINDATVKSRWIGYNQF